jgi:hypothetical protein
MGIQDCLTLATRVENALGLKKRILRSNEYITLPTTIGSRETSTPGTCRIFTLHQHAQSVLVTHLV